MVFSTYASVFSLIMAIYSRNM